LAARPFASGKSIVRTVDAWQRRNPAGGLPLAVLKKFSDDRGSSLAALIAFYAFFSLFPLLLALVSILGFVLEGNPSLRDDVLDTALARIPVIGDQLRNQVEPLQGSGIALVVGLIGALWAGLGVTLALGRAFADTWDVPRVDQPSGLKARARGLAMLGILAVTLVVATAATGVAVGGDLGPGAEEAAAVILSFTVNVVVFLTVFGLLTPRPYRIRELLPGVTVAALGWLVLQSLGGWYVDLTISNATGTYGTFALVIGLLSWFLLAAHVVLLAVETNAVLRWRLWPRSLTGELEPADRHALQRFAEAARRDRSERIAVSFEEGDEPG
jgi:YihY family inner membrane protein